MQSINDLTKSLIENYNQVKEGIMPVKKGLALAYMANTILKSIVVDVQFTSNPKQKKIKE